MWSRLFIPLLLPALAAATVKPLEIRQILRLEVNSSINPATYDYLKGGLQKARQKNADLLLIRLNTPGGLVSTTKDILALFGQSDIPVAVWIAPEGASATSAGAIIASGAHILVMSSGTNIGAATPVQMGKDTGKDMRQKAINDLVALVQSLAETRGRNARDFGLMISKAKSFKAREAQQKQLVDAIVNSEADFLAHLKGRLITFKGEKRRLLTDQVNVQALPMNVGQSLLNIFANPSLAYILFLLGAALLYLELQAPGGFIAGSVGALCLILAAIGLQVLPLNVGALGLIVLSFALFMMEAWITSYGLLSLAGLASLVAGSLFLFRTDNSYMALSTTVIFSSAAAIGAFLLLVLGVVCKTHKKIGNKKFNELKGKSAEVMAILSGGLYQVKVGGEIWQARSRQDLQEGDQRIVLDQDDETMILELSK